MSGAAGFILNCSTDEATRRLHRRLLDEAGHDVVDAATGSAALELARQRPALILLDGDFPDLTGDELCRRWKSDRRTSGIPVLTTAHGRGGQQNERVAVDACLSHPVEASALRSTVQALLRASRAENDARHGRVVWQRTLDAIDDSVAVVDPEGRIVHANASLRQRVGPRRDVVLGSSCADVLRAALGVDQGPMLAAPLETGAPASTEMPVDGRWLRVAVNPVIDDDAGIDRVVTIADVTEHHQLEDVRRLRAEEEAEAGRRKDAFLAVLAHELRNPLNAIAAAVRLQDRLGSEDDRSLRLRTVIERQTRNLARLVDDLLETSRLTHGQIRLRTEDVDVRQLVGRALQAVMPDIDERHQFVAEDLPPDPAVVCADPVRLEQVLSNVIANASKYSSPGGHISIACTATADEVTVLVGDDGAGIAPDQLETIFGSFVQADQSLARTEGGLGLGLTIARQLMELHDGTITARSRGLGKGAEFVVTLPRVSSGRAAAVPGHERTTARRRIKVLLVEDNSDTRELMRELIHEWGHQVVVAADGRAGVEAALAERPDVALVDIGLPGLNGYQVASQIRSHVGKRELLLVAMTGYGRPEDVQRALESGFDRHLVKPVATDQLQRLLANPTASNVGTR